jgi:HD-like signal output (HDOD) protein
MGTDHCQIGYLLTQEWQIAEPISVAIRDHHNTEPPPKAQSPTGILIMAEYIVNQVGFSIKDDLPTTLMPELAKHIQKNVAEYKVLAEDLIEEVENANNMYGN